MTIFMKISMDKYELPEAVADNSKELAEMCGVSRSTVEANISRWRRGILKRSRYITVEVEVEA